MKQIEVFVDSVYNRAGGSTKEVKELKAELKSHLLEAVQDLKAQGTSEQEAITIALERFGGESEMRSLVDQLFKAQKVFAKRLLQTALAFLVVTSVICGGLWAMDESEMKENVTVVDKIIGTENTAGILEGKEAISEDAKEKIEALVRDHNQILNLQVFKMTDVAKTSETGSVYYRVDEAAPAYKVGKSPSDEKNWMLIKEEYLYDNDWYVQLEAVKLFAFIPFVLLIGLAIYATLFTIWASINAYHHRRLNTGWVLAFALLNVVGYLVYYLSGRKAMV
ncbi:permease prefix domain 1-containing protein [Fictibacillus aquaticus]|uniref:Uncharacterized protein n=1 Tax=Fictibacillus aquaticus TaxID=2021314 RepID=A0A235F7R7_9BACL|nr:permease prefix domain 1-containing protein [Fictibacillus aquaticus]OYD57298.1 hypothetical protein CGZ90_11460 [Fictibacillus aquaticus]